MLRRLNVIGASFAMIPLLGWVAADEQITLVVPGIQCARCAEALTNSLTLSDSSVKVGGIGVETKQVPITYDPSKVTLHQLVETVAKTTPIHGKSYQAGLVVTVEDPVKSAAKVKTALKKVKGVADFTRPPSATDPGEIMITLTALPRQAKANDMVRTSQIAEALEKSGVKFSGLPTSSGGGFPELDSKKKQPGTKGSVKSKAGGDEMPAEKAKPARPSAAGPKTKPARDPSAASAKAKDDSPEQKPRFQILGGGGEKVFLADNEAKLKKLVKVGDKFGDLVVKEITDEGGLVVVLEDPETKEKIRIEHESKNKKEGSKDPIRVEDKKEKPKDDKEKDSTEKSPDDKEKKDKNEN